MYRIGIFFGIAKISNIFGGMPDIQDFILVNSRCESKPTYEEKVRVPLPPGV